MIFSRREIQRMLDELRPVLGPKSSSALKHRLNRPGADRLAAMWEVAVMAQLVKFGTLQHELRLASGKRPDIFFEGTDDLSFHADVTTVSDAGVERRNPFQEFLDLIETAKRSLGLGVGGHYLNVLERDEITTKGRRRKLRLPPRENLAQHVQDVIVPEMKRQLALSKWPLELKFDDDTVGYGLQIKDGPYSGGSFGAYDIPTIDEQNPLF